MNQKQEKLVAQLAVHGETEAELRRQLAISRNRRADLVERALRAGISMALIGRTLDISRETLYARRKRDGRDV